MIIETNIEGLKTYQSASDIPYIRLAAFESLSRQSELKIRDRNLIDIFDTFNKLAIEKDYANITQLSAYAKSVIQQIANQNILLEIGSVFIIIEGEDENDLQQYWTNKKIELALSNNEIAAFFLRTSINCLNLLRSNTQSSSIMDFSINQTLIHPEKILTEFLQSISKKLKE